MGSLRQFLYSKDLGPPILQRVASVVYRCDRFGGLGGGSGGETYDDTVELVDVRCEILSMGQQFQNLMNAIDVEELGLEGKDMPYGMADKKRSL